MYVAHLSLTDFRSYPEAELPLEPGRHGAGRAERPGQDQPGRGDRLRRDPGLAPGLLRRAAGPVRRPPGDRALRGRPARPARPWSSWSSPPGKANRARLNRSPVPRPREVLGTLSTVLFAPEDLALVKGDPAERRRFLDELLVARAPAAGRRAVGLRAGAQAAQRPAEVGRRRDQARAAATCGPWTSGTRTWPTAGAELLAARLLAGRRPRAVRRAAYTQVSDNQGPAAITYRASLAEHEDGAGPERPAPVRAGPGAAGRPAAGGDGPAAPGRAGARHLAGRAAPRRPGAVARADAGQGVRQPR